MDGSESSNNRDDLGKSRRLLLDAELIGHIGSWEIDLVTGEVISTEGNRRLFFGTDATRGRRFEDYSEAVHPDDRDEVLRRREELLEGKGSPEIEYRVVLPNGEVRVIRGVQRVVRDASGKPVRAFGINADLTDRKRAEQELDCRLRQQAAVAQLGQSALQGRDMQPLLEEALELVARACSAEIADVAELREDDTLVFRATAGWNGRLPGGATFPAGDGSLFAPTLASGVPLVVEDLALETRVPAATLLEHGIVSGVSVLIRGDGRPFGILSAHSRERRVFARDDVIFLQSIANVLAAAIDRDRTSSELRDKREQLQVLSHKLIEAQETERRTIARELHDDLGQVLTAIRTNLQRAGQQKAGGTAENLALIDGAIDRMRDLALTLRPSMLDDLGLAAALRWYTSREGARAGLEFDVDFSLESRLPPAIETTCFRVTQEAITNIVRHAAARRVGVVLRAVDGAAELVVRDDGAGFDVASARANAGRGASQGLLTMQERVSLVGGTLAIESIPGRGTTVRARFPAPQSSR